MRQTAEFILKSFRKSRKRHLLITGTRGIGKTTLFHKLVNQISGTEERIPGITTYAVPKECVMLRENSTDKEMVIGRYCLGQREKSNAMVPVQEGFRMLGISALKRALADRSVWFTIDEIGYLESEELEFQRMLFEVFEKKQVLAVLRKQDLPFINELKNRNDVFVIDLDDRGIRTGCVIMASGMGRRFGQNKVLADFSGKPMLQWTLECTEGLFERRVVVTRSAEVAEFCRNQGVQFVLHDFPNRNDTVRLGVECMKAMDSCMFCPCDQPLLKRESLLRMFTKSMLDDAEILRLSYGEKQGAPVLFGKSYFPELCSLPEKCGGSYLTKKYPEHVRTVPAFNKYELYDVDTREDLEKLKKILETGL